MAAHVLARVFFATLLLAALASSAFAQFMPGVPGGGAMKRTDRSTNPSAPAWQIRDRGVGSWFAPRWIPGRSPVGGSFGRTETRAVLRMALRSRLP